MFWNYLAKCARARVFSLARFVGFYFRIYCFFLDFLCSFTEMKADTVCARAQAAILRSSGHLIK